MNVREEVTQVEGYTNTVVKTHPLDEPLHKAAWEALTFYGYINWSEEAIAVNTRLREALATQGVTAESIREFEEAKK